MSKKLKIPVLEENIKKLSLLAEIAIDPLLLADETGEIISANKPACGLFTPEIENTTSAALNLVGRNLSEFIPRPELEELIYCAFISDDEEDCPETQLQINDRIFQTYCTAIEMDNGDSYLGLALKDVTQLMRLNRARRDLVANISHELRTPIAGIRLLAETLSRNQPGKKNRRKIIRKLIRKLSRELDNLQRIVEGMRDLSMIESGQAIMRLVEVPLAPLIESALESFDERLEQKRIKTKVYVPDNITVLVDEGQIGRVLANLIHNAIKFSPKKGRVEIVVSTEIEDEVTIRIVDNGPGIPADERDRVFERFYQIDEARTARRGSGLGLAIAKHIVGAHGGRVWVEDSTLGGACLCLTLSVIQKPPESEPSN